MTIKRRALIKNLDLAAPLEAASVDAAHATEAVDQHSYLPIMHWLDMSDVKGRTLWPSTGHKLTSVDQVPSEFRSAVEAVYPGSLEDPENYVKPA